MLDVNWLKSTATDAYPCNNIVKCSHCDTVGAVKLHVCTARRHCMNASNYIMYR